MDVVPYLALREEKIRRNEERLRKLGLVSGSYPSVLVVSPVSPVVKKRKTSTPYNDSVPLRRSARKRTAVSSYLEEPLPAFPSSSRGPTREEKDAKEADGKFNPEEIDNYTMMECPPTARLVSPTKAKVKQFASNSARSLAIDIERLLFGSQGSSSGVLGMTMKETGKAFVMEQSALSGLDGFPGGPISFNKYSGVQEWGNEVLFLWINLNAPNCDVKNEFPGGNAVTWFGGSRMHDDSPVIRKLLRVGSSSPTPSRGIVLWCRKYVPSRKTFTPYTCLGRLVYASHIPGSRPLSFVWKLYDLPRLKNHNDESVQTHFKYLVC